MDEYGFGAVPSPPDIRDYVLSTPNLDTSNLPSSYIIKPLKIKSQGSQLTCVAHVLSSIVEFHTMKDTNERINYSTEFIYGCRLDSDYFGEGMYLRDGLKVIQKYGDVEYSVLPGNSNVPQAYDKVSQNFEQLQPLAYPNRISTYYKINSLDELKYSLYHYGPVAASMHWYKGAKVDKNGIYQYNPANSKSGHAVLIIGWTEDNLIIQNSWGTTFGKHGLFYVPFDKIEEVFFEFYGVTDDITNIKTPSKTVNKWSPLINFILKLITNLFK